ncbi:hypothetical protein [Nonomuraea sp. JJY05]
MPSRGEALAPARTAAAARARPVPHPDFSALRESVAAAVRQAASDPEVD